MKKILASILIFTTLISSSALAAVDKIYDLTTSETIIDGITRTHIKRLSSAGWQNINIVEADISMDHLDITLLKSDKSIHKLDNVLNMAKNNNTFAAINGDFFSWSSSVKGDGSSVGVEYNNGQHISSFANSWEFASVIQQYDGNFIFDYIDANMYITAPNGKTEQVRHINKYDPLDKIVMYDRTWGEMSPGSYSFQVEVVVQDDKVVSINYDKGSVEIPENGYVLSFLSDHTKFLIDNFSVGDPISLSVSLKPNVENIKFAVGAGTLLVKDGKKTEITHKVNGNNPRTVLGISADQTKIYLITVDGRQEKSVGMTLSALADMLIDYGIDTAVNLDGGGSTTLVTKSFGDDENKVANLPSEGSLRSVANGIGIVSNVPSNGLSVINLTTENKYVFDGTSAKINAIGLDEYLRKESIDTSNIIWSSSNANDTFKGNTFYPSGAGLRTITATYNGISGHLDINVLNAPSSIAITNKNISIKKGETTYITIYAYDENGYMSPINLSDLNISLSSDLLMFNGNNMTANSSGSALVTFEINGVTTNCIVNVDGHQSNIELPNDIAKHDAANVEKNVPSSDTSYSFAVFGDLIHNETLGKNLAIQDVAEAISSKNELAYFVGNATEVPKALNITSVKTSGHMIADYKGDTFITLDNSENSIFDTDISQWSWFINNIEATSADNVFIFLSKGLYFKNDYEEELFYNVIDKYITSRGKKAHIFYNHSPRVVARNGVKFYSIPGLSAYEGSKDMVENLSYICVSVNNSEVTYQIKKVY